MNRKDQVPKLSWRPLRSLSSPSPSPSFYDNSISSPFASKSSESVQTSRLVNRNPIKLPIKKVVMIRKITLLEQLQDEMTFMDTSPHSINDSQVQKAHHDTVVAAETVEHELRSRNLEVRVRYRVKREDIVWADLLVAVGGDGTFLHASHHLEEGDTTPIIAVNSSPASSYGYFCAATQETFPAWLSGISEGLIGTSSLFRMRVFKNHVLQPIRVLNDCLFAAEIAACTTRYQIAYRDHAQLQKSSGVWIATAAGSTAGIRSAGGVIEPLHHSRLQFWVRELFPENLVGEPIRHGFIERADDFRIVSRIANAKLFFDGPRLATDVAYGDIVSFAPTVRPVEWVRPAAIPEWLPRSEPS